MNYLQAIKNSSVAVLVAIPLFSSSASAEVQQVELIGDLSEVSVMYRSSDASQTAGIGIRVHFNSSQVSIADITDVFRESLIGVQILDDAKNYDGDDATDSYVSCAWANINIAWPTDPSASVKLLTLKLGDALAGNQFNVTKISADNRYDFSGIGLQLN